MTTARMNEILALMKAEEIRDALDMIPKNWSRELR